MTGNFAFDVAIGLIFVYTLYSLLTTTIIEIFAINLQFRARNLAKAICRMLDDENNELFSSKFFRQPIIKFMASGWLKLFNKPSFIHSHNFSRALVQVLINEAESGNNPVEKIKSALSKANYKDTETGKLLLSLLEEAEFELDKFRLLLEQWFDDMMERATSWYKKYMVLATFMCGFIVAMVFNVDTFQIASYLSKDKDAREEFVQLAGNLVANNSFVNPVFDTTLRSRLLTDSLLKQRFVNNPEALKAFVNDSVYNKVNEAKEILMQRMDTLYSVSRQSQNILSFKRGENQAYLFDSWHNFWGCLVTALALSLGAPFWFDLLKKMLQLRSSANKLLTSQSVENTNNSGLSVKKEKK